MNESSNNFELVLMNALKLPGIKVNRKEFLVRSFSKKVLEEELMEIIKKGPLESNVEIKKINKIAQNLIGTRTLTSSGMSFAAGLPGGPAMAATIPADTLQFFGTILRLAQELGYLYGHDDFWDEDELNVEAINGDLVLYLGVMFGVGGSVAAIKVLSTKLSQEALKKIPQKALTKTIYYPIIKNVLSKLGINVTKSTFAKGISKTIPVIGGVVSGGLTYASMSKMGKKLQLALADTIDLTDTDIEKSFDDLKKSYSEIIEAHYTEIVTNK